MQRQKKGKTGEKAVPEYVERHGRGGVGAKDKDYQSLVYPDLRRKLFGNLLSALIEEREKGIEREKDGQQEGTEDHINNVPEVMEESIDDITSVLPQFSLYGPLNHGPGSGPLMADAQADSETRPIDHPPTSDEHLSTVIIVGTEVPEPTSGGQISQPSVGEAATLLSA